MNGRPVEWTADQVATVKDLWGRGFSAGRITRELPFTRNAVISKLNRLGLIGQRRAAQPTGKPKPEPKAQRQPGTPRNLTRFKAIAAGSDPGLAPHIETPEPNMHGIQLVELTNTTCRWPKGLVGADDFCFCGEPTADLAGGKPYCPRHTRLARRTA